MSNVHYCMSVVKNLHQIDRHVKFLKKNAGQSAENPWFFKKIRFPMSTDVVNPAVRELKCLQQTLQYACCLPRSLAITQSNVLVYSALKFDPLLYRIRFFAGLIVGDESRSAIFVGFIKLYSRLDYLYLYYSVYIQALNWYWFFSDWDALPHSYSKLPSFITISILIIVANRKLEMRYRQASRECNIDFSRRLPPNYHKKWLLTKKTNGKTERIFENPWFFFKNLFCRKRQSFP